MKDIKKVINKKGGRAKKHQKNAAEALLHLAEMGEKRNVRGPKDLSQRIDEFVYRT